MSILSDGKDIITRIVISVGDCLEVVDKGAGGRVSSLTNPFSLPLAEGEGKPPAPGTQGSLLRGSEEIK